MRFKFGYFWFTIFILLGYLHGQNLISDKKTSEILTITSKPIGAKIFISDTFLGLTPLRLNDYPKGTYNIKIELNPSEFQEIKYNYIGGMQELYLILDGNYGILDFYSEPTNAKVFIDDSLLGYTPLLNIEHPTGLAKIKFTKDNYFSIEQTISIYRKKHRVFRKLKYKYGYLSLKPDSNNLMIKLDGKISTHLLNDKQINVGMHDIEIINKNFYRSVSEKIEISPLSRNNLMFKYDKFSFKYILKSAFLPGLGQLSDKQSLKGILFLLGFATSAALFTKEEIDYLGQLDVYNSAHSKYLKADTEKDAITFRDKMLAEMDVLNSKISKKNTYFGFIIGVYLLNLIDALIFHHKYARIELITTQLKRPLDNNKNQVGIKFKF